MDTFAIVHRDGSSTDDDIIPKVLSIYQVLREFIARLSLSMSVCVCLSERPRRGRRLAETRFWLLN